MLLPILFVDFFASKKKDHPLALKRVLEWSFFIDAFQSVRSSGEDIQIETSY